MRQQVIQTRHVPPQPTGHHHVPQLAQGGVGHDPLHVVLGQGNRGPDHHGQAAHDGHDRHRHGGQVVQRGKPRHHEHPRRHHGRRVNQGGNRRRPFHGVWQPHVQRNLRGLADRTDKQQQAHHGQYGHVPSAAHRSKKIDGGADVSGGVGKDRPVLQRPKDDKHQQDAQQKSEVADSIDDKCLSGRGSCGMAVIPMSDQQIRTQPDRFPEDEELEEIIRHDQHQHGEGKQRDIGEKSRVARFPVHVPDGIDVYQSADDGDQQQHGSGQLIDVKTQANGEIAGCRPDVEGNFQHVAIGDFSKRQYRQEKGQPHGRHREQMRPVPDDVPGQAEHDERRQGQDGNQDVQHGATISINGTHRR